MEVTTIAARMSGRVGWWSGMESGGPGKELNNIYAIAESTRNIRLVHFVLKIVEDLTTSIHNIVT